MSHDVKGAAGASEISILELLVIVLQNRRLLVAVPILVAVMVVAITLLQPRSYSATTAFMPQASDRGAASGLAGIVAQFGVAIPTSGSGRSPEFYADLVASRPLLYELVADSFAVRPGTTPCPLMDILVGDSPSDPDLKRDLAARQVGELLTVRTSTATGTVRVTVKMGSPALAYAIVTRLVALVQEFNSFSYQTQAGAERRFIEQRLSEARDSLAKIEQQWAAFLDENRAFEQSAQLSFEDNRLQRTVRFHQEIVTTLSKAFEQARIEEVRNTPVVTVVEPALLPVQPDRRRLVVRATIALLLGLAVAAVVAVGRTVLVDDMRTRPDRYAAWEIERHRLRADIGRMIRRVPILRTRFANERYPREG